jgi:nucleotide-binding universal stress UspA family protein
MNTYRSILLHVDASSRSAPRVRFAQQLARAHGADLTAMYAVTPLMTRHASAMALDAGLAALLMTTDQTLRERARAMVEKTAASQVPQPRWLAGDGLAEAVFWRAAFCADLMVLGQSVPADEDDGGVDSDFVQTVVIESGRPAMVLPYIGVPSEFGRTLLVAWKETREAARAVTAAIPFLQRAARVHVVSFGGEGGAAGTPSIDAYLRLHGVSVTLHHEAAEPPGDMGDCLLSRVTDLGADMMVMGCFGHSRAREWVLGGATRTVLKSMTVPVLMAH